MKRLSLILAFTLAAGSISAQTPQATPESGSAIDHEDAKKIQDGVKKLAKAFDVPATQAATPAPAAPVPVAQQNPPQKSMADVADKALDMFSGVVGQISDALKKVAPEVWRIMIRQQYAKAVGHLITPWGVFILIFLLRLYFRRNWYCSKRTQPEGEKKEIAMCEDCRAWRAAIMTFAAPLAMLVMGIWGVIAISHTVLYLINPEYYAIRDLLEMILRSGAV